MVERIDDDGIWYQYTAPAAVQQGEKTFFGRVTGGNNGHIDVGEFDHETGEVTFNRIESNFDYDDHASPSLLVRDDDHITVTYTEHHDTTCRVRISDDPLDISSFGDAHTFTTDHSGLLTYPQPVQLSDEDNRIYVFYRGTSGSTDREWCYRTSDDGGVTWNDESVLRENFSDWTDGIVNPYTVCISDGARRIHFTSFNYEQLAEGGTPYDIYHWYYEDGSFYESDGTHIKDEGTPLNSSDEPTTVDGSDDVNIWDIALDDNGNPVIVYVKYQDYDTSHIYKYARWTGSAWETNDIVDSGGPVADADGREWYSGGVRLNQTDPSVVYTAEEETDGVFHVYKYSTDDGGSIWTEEAEYVGLDGEKNFRPRYPRNASEEHLEVLFVAGWYEDLRDYDTGVYGEVGVSPEVTEFIGDVGGRRRSLFANVDAVAALADDQARKVSKAVVRKGGKLREVFRR